MSKVHFGRNITKTFDSKSSSGYVETNGGFHRTVECSDVGKECCDVGVDIHINISRPSAILLYSNTLTTAPSVFELSQVTPTSKNFWMVKVSSILKCHVTKTLLENNFERVWFVAIWRWMNIVCDSSVVL